MAVRFGDMFSALVFLLASCAVPEIYHRGSNDEHGSFSHDERLVYSLPVAPPLDTATVNTRVSVLGGGVVFSAGIVRRFLFPSRFIVVARLDYPRSLPSKQSPVVLVPFEMFVSPTMKPQFFTAAIQGMYRIHETLSSVRGYVLLVQNGTIFVRKFSVRIRPEFFCFFRRYHIEGIER